MEDDRTAWLEARRRLFRPVCVLFLALTIACAVGLRVPAPLQYIPFLVSLVLLGLPHGALDHLVPARLARRHPDRRSLARVVVLYAVVGGLVTGLWFASPALAFVVFVLTTWFHWGQGDLFVEAMRPGTAEPSRLTRAGMLAVRGALPMLVPLLAAPEVYVSVFRGATGVIAAPAIDTTFLASGEFRMPVALAFVALVALTFVGTARARRSDGAGRRAWWGDLGEVVLLAAFFTVVPPILAVGLYFCLWHSLRHIVRLSLLDPARDELSRWSPRVALRRFATQSAPVTAIALGLLVTLFLTVPRAGLDSMSLLGVYLVLISALTLPHVVVVTIMDVRQAPWSRRVELASEGASAS